MAIKAKSFTVEPEHQGTRLDIFLSAQLGQSRSQTQKLIAENRVLVDTMPPKKAGDQLRAGQTVELLPPPKAVPPAPTPKNAQGAPVKKKKAAVVTIKIVAETPDYLVAEKPTGLLTHPTMAEEADTLSGRLLKQYPELAGVGDDPVRPGIVHRLDKEASGLLVVARTQKMFDHLKHQFKNRTIEKEYIVLVHGRVARDEVTIDFPITRSETSDRMAARPTTHRGEATTQGKEALTEFLVEQRFVNFSLLQVRIHTGRMHQIRVHLLAYNHPVVGDPLYIKRAQKRVWDERLGRLFLHAAKLSFIDLDGNREQFSSKLPAELEHFLTLLS